MRQQQFPVEFDKLSPEQLNEVHIWLDDFSYRVTLEKLKAQFGIKITQSKLHRYNQKRELADEICCEEEFQVDMKQWYDLINGNHVPYDQATLKLLSKRIFEYLLNPANKVTASSLAVLHRLATYETTLDITLRRLALAEHKNALTSKTLQKTQPRVSPAKPGPKVPSNHPATVPPTPKESHNDTAFSPKPAPVTSAPTKPSGPTTDSELVFPSPLDSIITPLPTSPAPFSPALVTQILKQLPKDLTKKSKSAMAA